ncbi:MAG: amidohydrolase family protein [Thermoleophilia bacterium]|nr:amidohydrolase family protein [Thermoleophilia bacterium]
MTRVWGEDAAALVAAGADAAALAALEDGLLDGFALPAGPRWDAHTHLGRDADGHALDTAGLVADMDRWGVAGAVAFPANEPGDDGSFTVANDAVLAAAAAHPGRIVPVCRADPRAGWAAAVDRAAAGGARGLKLHPVAQGFAPESPECVACVAAATALGWPVLFHAGFGARRLAGPFRDLAAAVPGARLILAHGARGDARAVREAFAGHPGVWFDTSLAALPDLVELPPGRLVWGSDRPYGEHGTALQLVALAARVAGWSPSEVAGVLGGNLLALLGEPA